uniref:NADH-ubiquinone oxidoreductase chain 6 n=1 Tax=Lepilemur randrianasoloi TaxID=886965 RepID=A0A1W5G6M5_LEPRA|nr:NADH dehydrogenase subunit 6 [Lepilemur randrianasoloi]ADP68139.1 NADH dehydrogenase subunit 6 [Lepilemur randrianasoloi]ADP68152.1 NADH dehydrogenase subunit 6 [Lepilemur randrianasoloi]
MIYMMFLLSVVFVLGFMSFSSKPSPIYGGVGLVVSGAVGCIIIMGFGGSFVGLMVFLVYLGGMLVVFGYTTAMATEEYPETWGSSVVVWGSLLMGLVMELLVVVWVMGQDSFEVVVGFDDLEDWVVFTGKEISTVREDSLGVAALYNYVSWFMVVAGWSLFISVLIVIEIIRM